MFYCLKVFKGKLTEDQVKVIKSNFFGLKSSLHIKTLQTKTFLILRLIMNFLETEEASMLISQMDTRISWPTFFPLQSDSSFCYVSLMLLLLFFILTIFSLVITFCCICTRDSFSTLISDCCKPFCTFVWWCHAHYHQDVTLSTLNQYSQWSSFIF